MTRITVAAAIALAAMLPLSAPAAFAETGANQAALCTEAPAKAAKAGIDCTATSQTKAQGNDKAKKYPKSPVSFGNGIVF